MPPLRNRPSFLVLAVSRKTQWNMQLPPIARGLAAVKEFADSTGCSGWGNAAGHRIGRPCRPGGHCGSRALCQWGLGRSGSATRILKPAMNEPQLCKRPAWNRLSLPDWIGCRVSLRRAAAEQRHRGRPQLIRRARLKRDRAQRLALACRASAPRRVDRRSLIDRRVPAGSMGGCRRHSDRKAAAIKGFPTIDFDHAWVNGSSRCRRWSSVPITPTDLVVLADVLLLPTWLRPVSSRPAASARLARTPSLLESSVSSSIANSEYSRYSQGLHARTSIRGHPNGVRIMHDLVRARPPGGLRR
jgi:hypothetical protein